MPAIIAGPSTRPVRAARTVERQNVMPKAILSSSFLKGTGREFLGQSLRKDAQASKMSTTRNVTTMAAKSEF